MGLFLEHKKNRGVNIQGNDKCIDIIVREIGGPNGQREGIFEIRGLDSLNNLHLTYSNGLIRLEEGLEMGIRQVKTKYGRRLPVHYRISGEYSVTKRRYV